MLAAVAARSPVAVRASVPVLVQSRGLARRRGGTSSSGTTTTTATAEPEDKQLVETNNVPAPAPVAPSYGPWQPVVDKNTQMVYYWNTETNETTAVGQLPPGVVAPHQTVPMQSQQPTLGRAVAEGAAWGVGMGVGREVVGSLFGGVFGGGDDEPPVSGGGGGGDDGWI